MTGPELKAWRAHWHVSQAGLATTLGVAQNTVGRWERGERDIPPFLPLALSGLELQLSAELRQRARGQRAGAGKTRGDAATNVAPADTVPPEDLTS